MNISFWTAFRSSQISVGTSVRHSQSGQATTPWQPEMKIRPGAMEFAVLQDCLPRNRIISALSLTLYVSVPMWMPCQTVSTTTSHLSSLQVVTILAWMVFTFMLTVDISYMRPVLWSVSVFWGSISRVICELVAHSKWVSQFVTAVGYPDLDGLAGSARQDLVQGLYTAQTDQKSRTGFAASQRHLR